MFFLDLQSITLSTDWIYWCISKFIIRFYCIYTQKEKNNKQKKERKDRKKKRSTDDVIARRCINLRIQKSKTV